MSFAAVFKKAHGSRVNPAIELSILRKSRKRKRRIRALLWIGGMAVGFFLIAGLLWGFLLKEER